MHAVPCVDGNEWSVCLLDLTPELIMYSYVCSLYLLRLQSSPAQVCAAICPPSIYICGSSGYLSEQGDPTC